MNKSMHVASPSFKGLSLWGSVFNHPLWGDCGSGGSRSSTTTGSLVVPSLELIGQDTKPQVAPDKFIRVCMFARKHSDTEGGACVDG